MSGLQVVGVLMVGAVLVAAFAATTWGMGVRPSVALWSLSVAVTAFVCVGVGLATGDLR